MDRSRSPWFVAVVFAGTAGCGAVDKLSDANNGSADAPHTDALGDSNGQLDAANTAGTDVGDGTVTISW